MSTGQQLKPPVPICFYHYKNLEKFDNNTPGALLFPHGENLFTVVYGSEELRKWMVSLYEPYGLYIMMKPVIKTFELQKL